MSDLSFFTLKKVSQIFGEDVHLTKSKLIELEKNKLIPKLKQMKRGATKVKGWDSHDLPEIGEQLGFLTRPKKPLAISVFTTKGGVLKTTLSLNLARVAALHNIKTCVVGLDVQGDITTALGHDGEYENYSGIEDVISRIDSIKGLADIFSGKSILEDVIVPTDLPNLFLIPETPELVAMNDSINNINKREFWLKDRIVDKLKQNFDLIIMDCSPNWNKLTTNALVASDALISPLECKINNFRNFKVFQEFLREFKEDMSLKFDQIFIPTKFSLNKKLSLEIKDWYESNVDGCLHDGIRESVSGEEATALNISMIEHAPNSKVSAEFKQIVKSVFEQFGRKRTDPVNNMFSFNTDSFDYNSNEIK